MQWSELLAFEKLWSGWKLHSFTYRILIRFQLLHIYIQANLSSNYQSNYTHTWAHTCPHMYTCTHIRTCTHTSMHLRTHVHTYAHTACTQYTHVCTHAHWLSFTNMFPFLSSAFIVLWAGHSWLCELATHTYSWPPFNRRPWFWVLRYNLHSSIIP